MEERWALDIKALCRASHTPFFFKQWGGVNKKAAGRLLEAGHMTRCQGPIQEDGERGTGLFGIGLRRLSAPTKCPAGRPANEERNANREAVTVGEAVGEIREFCRRRQLLFADSRGGT